MSVAVELPPRASTQRMVFDIVAASPEGISKRLLVKQCCSRPSVGRGAIYRALGALVAGGHVVREEVTDVLLATAHTSEAQNAGNVSSVPTTGTHDKSAQTDASGRKVIRSKAPAGPPVRPAHSASARFLRQEVALQNTIVAALTKARFGLDIDALILAVERMLPRKHLKERLEGTLNAMASEGEIRLVGRRWVAPRRQRRI